MQIGCFVLLKENTSDISKINRNRVSWPNVRRTNTIFVFLFLLHKKFALVEVGCFASAQVVVPNSQQTSCLDGSFL